MAEMMAGMDANQNNPDWTEFLTGDEIRTIEEDSIVVRLRSLGLKVPAVNRRQEIGGRKSFQLLSRIPFLADHLLQKQTSQYLVTRT